MSETNFSNPENIAPENTAPENIAPENIASDNFVVEQLLDEIAQIIQSAKSSFRSSNRSEILSLLNQVKEKFPEEVGAARWLLKERKLFIERIQQEKIEIIEGAQRRAAELINRVEVVREAQRKAQDIIQSANEEATKMKSEMEGYCEKQLEKFESILARVYDEVQLGRTKLQSSTQESLESLANMQSELNFEQPEVQEVQEVQQEEMQNVEPKYESQTPSQRPELDPLLG